MEHKDRTVTVAIITGVVALLLGCCLGAMAGAMGGYFIGHQASSRWDERMAPDSFEMPMLPDLAGTKGALVQEVVAGLRPRRPECRSATSSPRSMARRSTQPPAGGCREPVPARRPRQNHGLARRRCQEYHGDTRRKSAGQCPPLSRGALRRLRGATRTIPSRMTERGREATDGHPARRNVSKVPPERFCRRDLLRFLGALRARTPQSTTPVRSAFFTSPIARVMSMSRAGFHAVVDVCGSATRRRSPPGWPAAPGRPGPGCRR